MKVITKKGNKGTVNIDTKKQAAILIDENNNSYLIAYMRDNKVKIKSDLHLNEVDLATVKQEMAKFIKADTSLAKKKRK